MRASMSGVINFFFEAIYAIQNQLRKTVARFISRFIHGEVNENDLYKLYGDRPVV